MTKLKCDQCANEMVRSKYQYRTLVPGAYEVLHPPEELLVCRTCGNVQVELATMVYFGQYAARKVLLDIPNVSGMTLRFARKVLGVPSAITAERLGIHPDELQRLEQAPAGRVPKAIGLAVAALLTDAMEQKQ